MSSPSLTPTSSTSAAPTVFPRRATRSSTTGLRIEHDQGDVEIVVYNRAIRLFRSDSEAVRRIHQVCCRLDDIAARSCRTGQTGLVKLYKWVAALKGLRT